MKKFLLALTAFAVVGLSGCSTTAPTAPTAQGDDRFDPWIDSKKVAQIENAAKNRNVRVIWIQYPAKQDTVTR